jgi:hypothetical protein
MTDLITEIQQKIERKLEMPEICKSIMHALSEVGFSKFEHSVDFITNKSMLSLSTTIL